MDATNQVSPKGCMNRAVPRDPGFPFEFRCAQHDVKVTFTRCGCSCMTRMGRAVIHNLDLAQIKRRAQLIFYFLPN